VTGLAAILALLALWTSAAAAQDEGLVFRDGDDLALTYKEARAGDGASLCNVSSGPARKVKVEFLGFQFKRDKKALPTTDALEPSGVPPTLGGGRCRQLTVKLKQGATLDAGRYAGKITVTSTAGLVRLGLTIAGPDTLVEAPKITGAVDTATLQGNRDGPWGDGIELKQGGVLPLQPPGAGVKLPAKDTFLGSLFRGTERARVFAAGGRVVKGKDVQFLPVRVEGAEHVGDFSGKLDLTGSAKTEKGLPVKLTVTDDVGWAIGAVLLGALAGFLAQLWVKRSRLRFRLWRRRSNFKGDYEEAEGKFRDNFPDLDGVLRPTDAATKKYVDQIDSAVGTYGSSTVYFDTTADPYKQIVASVELAERDITSLGSKDDGVGQALTVLQTELEHVLDFVNERFPSDDPPALVARGEKIHAGGRLEVGGAVKLADKAKEHTKYAKHWREMAGLALRYEAWWRRLAKLAANMSEEDRASLVRAGGMLAEVERELFDAADSTALDEAGSERTLDGVYDRLAYLGGLYGPWLCPQEERALDIPVRWDVLDSPQHIMTVLDAGAGVRHAIDEIREQVTGVFIRAARAADVTRRLGNFVDYLVLAFSVVVGVLTALGVLYFGKTFGTAADYITAFLTGAASQLLVTGLADTVSQMRTADADPAVATPPAPAKVELDAPSTAAS
jgi:hypothetical protein